MPLLEEALTSRFYFFAKIAKSNLEKIWALRRALFNNHGKIVLENATNMES